MDDAPPQMGQRRHAGILPKAEPAGL